MLLSRRHWSREMALLRLAISFFTRIPIKISGQVDEAMLNQASRYFALVGVIVGSVCASVFYLAQLLFPITLAVLLAMSVGVLLTGAFHEDGWADVWDGFGGGWQVADKLNIMKDSRLGTYGACSLFFILAIKFYALLYLAQQSQFDQGVMFTVFILGHSLSRLLATSLILDMPYVSEDAQAKVKPLAQELSLNSLFILLATGAVVLLFSLSFSNSLILIIALCCSRWLLKAWFLKQLTGYTGDCLGAAQQLTEVVIYLVLLALLPLPW